MNQFSEFLQCIENDFRDRGFSDVDIAPPANIEIPNLCLDISLDIHVHQAMWNVGTPGGCLTFSGSKDTFRRLGLLLVGFSIIASARDFERKRSGDSGFWRTAICLNLLGEGADKLIIGGGSDWLTFFDFVPTSVRYFYARTDSAADSREWAAVGRYDRPYFGFFDEKNSLEINWGPDWLPVKKGAIMMGKTTSALLRLGGFLLDFSHPDNDVGILELEQAFEQVAPMSYDMNFVLAGSVEEYLVFGYHTGEPTEQAKKLTSGLE